MMPLRPEPQASDARVVASPAGVGAETPSSSTGGAAPNACPRAVASCGRFVIVHAPVTGAGAGRNAIVSGATLASARPRAATVAFGATAPSIAAPTTTPGAAVWTASRTAASAAPYEAAPAAFGAGVRISCCTFVACCTSATA